MKYTQKFFSPHAQQFSHVDDVCEPNWTNRMKYFFFSFLFLYLLSRRSLSFRASSERKNVNFAKERKEKQKKRKKFLRSLFIFLCSSIDRNFCAKHSLMYIHMYQPFLFFFFSSFFCSVFSLLSNIFAELFLFRPYVYRNELDFSLSMLLPLLPFFCRKSLNFEPTAKWLAYKPLCEWRQCHRTWLGTKHKNWKSFSESKFVDSLYFFFGWNRESNQDFLFTQNRQTSK